MDAVKIIECPRDAWQGLPDIIPAEYKAEYLKGVGSGAHKFLTLDLSEVHVRSYGSTAIVEEHMHLRADNGGRIADVHNLVMTVWTKQQGKWHEAAWMAVGLPANRTTVSENK